jgi:hypothetical protein
MTVEDISYNVNEVPQLFAQYLKAGAMEGEYVLRHKDGTPIPIHYRAFVFRDGCNAAIWKPAKDWRETYLAALLEVDPTKLKSKLDAALAAIDRAREYQDPATQTASERQAMADAALSLKCAAAKREAQSLKQSKSPTATQASGVEWTPLIPEPQVHIVLLGAPYAGFACRSWSPTFPTEHRGW